MAHSVLLKLFGNNRISKIRWNCNTQLFWEKLYVNTNSEFSSAHVKTLWIHASYCILNMKNKLIKLVLNSFTFAVQYLFFLLNICSSIFIIWYCKLQLSNIIQNLSRNEHNMMWMTGVHDCRSLFWVLFIEILSISME